MDPARRDSTQDWRLPPESVPPTLTELEQRIDEALTTARASEAAVMTVGAAALDAAEQAHRAADLAERASAVVLAGSIAPAPSPGGRPAPRTVSAQSGSTSFDPGDHSLRDFIARADRVAARLRQLQQPAAAA